MARRDDNPTKKAKKDKSLPGEAQELFQLVVGYAKQETIGPLKDLRRFVAYGLGGAILSSLGAVLLLLGGLRLLQTETGDTFDGNWTFVPYVVVLAVGGGIAVGALRSVGKGQRRDTP